MSDIAREIVRTQEQIASDRSSYDDHCSQVAKLVFPRQDDFYNENKQEGGVKNTLRYDDTAVLALDRFAAAMESVLTPRASEWHKLTVSDERLLDDEEVQEWLDALTKTLFKLRYSTTANFASQQYENYMSLGAFGQSVLILEDMVGKGFRYKASHVAENYFMENIHGKVDRNYRRYKLTALQAAEKFGESELPERIKTCLNNNPTEKFEFIHCVIPNEDKGDWPFSSFHVAVDGAKLLKTGGYYTFPYIIGRYTTSPNERWGRSPAMSALAEIKMLNQMRKTDLRARHLAVDPVKLASDQSTIGKFFGTPGKINYGTLDANGNPLVKPFNEGSRIDISNDAIEQSRRFINDTFLVTLFQILVESPTMTATEVLQRAQEKGALLGPTMGRQQSETLGPMIEREISILERYGYFEDNGMLPMPAALKKAGGLIDIEYTSPLSRMQRSEEALATERTIQALLPFAQIPNGPLERVDWKEYADIIRDGNGAPAKLFRTPEEIQAEQEAKAQQQQIAQMIQAAPQVAGAVKDIAQAQSYQAA